MLTQEKLKELFHYKDGTLCWRVCPRRGVARDSSAGCLRKDGYVVLNFQGTYYYLHRLVWMYHNGEVPPGCEVDHKDTNPSNNLIDNLRLASSYANSCNTGLPTTNTSGVKGVRFEQGKWRAQIRVKGERIHLGVFDTKDEAEDVMRNQREYFHQEFFNHGEGSGLFNEMEV